MYENKKELYNTAVAIDMPNSRLLKSARLSEMDLRLLDIICLYVSEMNDKARYKYYYSLAAMHPKEARKGKFGTSIIIRPSLNEACARAIAPSRPPEQVWVLVLRQQEQDFQATIEGDRAPQRDCIDRRG